MRIGARVGMIGGALLLAAGCSDKTYVVYQLFLGGPPVTTGGAGGSGGEGTTTSSSSSTATTTSSTSTTGAGGQGGEGGQGGNGAQGGGGGALVCSSPADCPGSDGPCAVRTCEAGACGVQLAPVGLLLGAQVAGDCVVQACDGAGSVVEMWDGSDAADDGLDCTVDKCALGGTQHLAKPVGAPCWEAGNAKGVVCDGAGACVECASTECSSGKAAQCYQNKCLYFGCADGEKDFFETDIDCGGPTTGAKGPCAPCVAGKTCAIGLDCVSGVCNAGVCG